MSAPDTIRELIAYNEGNLTTALSGKADVPTGTPDGTKFLRDDNSWQAVSASASLSYQQASLASDVTVAAANTYYDGPSVTCGAGTWLICAQVQVARQATTAVQWTARIVEGSTVIAEAQQYMPSVNPGPANLAMFAVRVIGGSTVYTVRAAGSQTGLIKANPNTNSGASNSATRIIAVKIA